MGMFDYVRCQALLPDGFDATAMQFQSKDTPRQGMDLYVITADGRLLLRDADYVVEENADAFIGFFLNEVDGTERWIEIPFHGDIEFYASNLSACGFGLATTFDGAPPTFREYTARFTEGRLVRITGGIIEGHYANMEHVTKEEFKAREPALHAAWKAMRNAEKQGQASTEEV